VSQKKEKLNIPSIEKRAFANGDCIATRAFGKSELPTSITGLPGWNMRESGFGVDCVCMNILRRCPASLLISPLFDSDKSLAKNISTIHRQLCCVLG